MKNITNYIYESNKGFDWEDEANKDGIIQVTTKEFASGGRESNEVEWDIEQLEDNDDSWLVKATVVKSDIPRKFKKGWDIEFELSKDVSIWDIEDELLRAVEDERVGAWSSGH